MSMSKNPRAYRDVESVLRTALLAGGGRYDCGSKGAAIHFRQRAYKYRSLYIAEAQVRDGRPGIQVATFLDNMYLMIDEENPQVLLIMERKPKGALTDMEGNELSMDAILQETSLHTVEEVEEPEDELLVAALALAKGGKSAD